VLVSKELIDSDLFVVGKTIFGANQVARGYSFFLLMDFQGF